MIVPILKGGLGNQLFQVAAGYAHSLAMQTEFAINLTGTHHRGQGKSASHYRTSFYDAFGTTTEWPGQIYREPHFAYAPLPSQSDMTIDGYFQSVKYFADYTNHIREMLWLRIPQIISRTPLAQTLKDLGPYNVIHIRGGDYKNYPDTHPTCPAQYYKEAIQRVQCVRDSDIFFVCTDDPDHARGVLSVEGITPQTIYQRDLDSELADLYVMSQADAIIGCNSSFSWWGSFFNTTAKLRVFPQNWFGPKGPPDFQDIYMSDMTII